MARSIKKFDAGALFGVKEFNGVLLDGYSEPGMYTPKHEGYVWTMEMLTPLVAAHLLGKNLYVVGPNGCGKTVAIESFYGALNYNVRRLQHYQEMDPEAAIYSTTLESGEAGPELVREPGPLPLALENGDVFLADELPNGPASGNIVYNSVLEPSRELRLTYGGGIKVKANPMFRFVATGNTGLTAGNTDGLYAGATRQNAALEDRFVVAKASYPDLKHEVGILMQKVPDLDEELEATPLVRMAGFLRNAYMGEPQTYPLAVSTRALIDCAEMALMAGSVEFGIRMTMLNKLSYQEHIEVLQKAYEKAFGEYATKHPLV